MHRECDGHYFARVFCMRALISFVSASLLFAFAAVVQAAETQDAVADSRAMLEAGDAAAAITTLDAYLHDNPKDVSAKFTRALALVQLKRNNEAIAAFTELAKDLPKLAQPYNNLAAVYAAEGDYVKAQSSLQSALQRDPNSIGVRLNLGDVYASLALVEYRRALTLDGSNEVAKKKVADMEGLQSQADTATASAAAVAPKPSPAAPVKLAARPATPATGKPAPVDEKSLVSFLQLWTSMEAKGDLSQYLDLYSKNFQPPAGMDRKQWVEQVGQRLSSAKRAKITLKDLRWKAIEGGVLLQFQQELVSATGVNHSTELMRVVPTVDHSWRIISENETPA